MLWGLSSYPSSSIRHIAPCWGGDVDRWLRLGRQNQLKFGQACRLIGYLNHWLAVSGLVTLTWSAILAFVRENWACVCLRWHLYFRPDDNMEVGNTIVESQSGILSTEVCWIPQNGAMLNCLSHVDLDLMSSFRFICQSCLLKTLNPGLGRLYLHISGGKYIKSWRQRSLQLAHWYEHRSVQLH